jgi:hypothetical protein
MWEGNDLSSPDKVGVNAAKQARESNPPEAIKDCEQICRSRLTIFVKSVK